MLKFVKALKTLIGRQHLPSIEETEEAVINRLRAQGARIGTGCRIQNVEFSTEPYLVTIGDNTGISSGVKFLTHNGAARRLKSQRPQIQSFGKIVIGNDCFVGDNVIFLPGTIIGDDCIIGAGAVVRGIIPANSLVAGNPAQIIGRASLFYAKLAKSNDILDTFGLPEPDRRKLISSHFAAKDGSIEQHH